jgi:hypothetical protein
VEDEIASAPRVSLQAPERRLGPDLWALVQTQGSRLVSVTAVGTLRSARRQRAAFRLRFADGRVLKGRRFDSERQAEHAERLSAYLDPSCFPRLLARRGCAVLTEWVQGARLRAAAWSPELLQQAGALHGALHRTVVAEDLAAKAREQVVGWRSRLGRALDELVEREALDSGEAARALELAVARAPCSAEVGLGHGDFCPENIVVRGRRLQVVDNESVLVHACDYDLARTWYRWPMGPARRKAYDDGYRRHRDLAGFVTHLPHWATLVLVDAALFRLRAGIVGAERPLGKLRALAGVAGRRPAVLSRDSRP